MNGKTHASCPMHHLSSLLSYIFPLPYRVTAGFIVDAFDEADEDLAAADFYEGIHALAEEIMDGVGPADGAHELGFEFRADFVRRGERHGGGVSNNRNRRRLDRGGVK